MSDDVDDNYWIISLESPDNQPSDFNLNGEIFGLTPLSLTTILICSAPTLL